MQTIAEEPLETFVEAHIGRGGPGFYLADAYLQYVLWATEQAVRPILGKSRFAWKLEGMGFARTTRRSLAFFENARLKSKYAREVYRLSPKE